jgi:MtN3 and saliva related transmembrane protein
MAPTILATAASSWAVLMGISPVLQIRRMLRAQSSREVSVAYFTVLLIGFLLWIAYGVTAGILALVIPNTVALLVGTTVIIVALRLRNRPSGKTPPPGNLSRAATCPAPGVDVYRRVPRARERTVTRSWAPVLVKTDLR